ncbi:aquaporin Z [Microbacterium pseudoresistens]|uniref:Aquaporin Z n=1 Tax=Microbacterium pseudoresistens TaxID=640634 RepID=A0A7Y9EW98_9MICO|nr:aquaporin [Microbacterium pseudoresistens]NYD54976.1 aquaporin Z [Microbacterium pseudoresistens]
MSDSASTEIALGADGTPPTAPLTTRLVGEAFGTFMLVFGVIGTALFASTHFTEPGAASAVYLAVAFAVGLSVVAGVYAFGPISGGHFNPAVSVGAAAAGRLPWREVGPYVIAQAIGAVVATTVLTLIGSFGPADWLTRVQDAGFISNGFDHLSPGGFGLFAAIIVEVLLTAVFVYVVLGTTHPARGTRMAGLAIGLTLTLIHLISIPVDNASVNPARSLATAIYGGIEPLAQLWVFLVFPVLGAIIAGMTYRALFDSAGPVSAGRVAAGESDSE